MSAQPVDTFTTQDTINSYLSTLDQKYLANNQVVLSSTSTGLVSAFIEAIAPWGNLSNRYFPTVAGFPSVGSNILSRDQLGGYHLPQNLGASTYLTKGITYSVNTSLLSAGQVLFYTDPTIYNKGRGLTFKDQSNIVTHYVNVNWMKSQFSASTFNGNLINTDTYQKFIPYQSTYESTKSDSNGVINARYDYEFWTGPFKNIWNQNNQANTVTNLGYYNLSGRITNLLYTPGQELYSWGTDVFGNQYALYKPLSNPRSLYVDANTYGNVWVKTIDGTISPDASALNLVYTNFANNASIYNLLTSPSNTIVNFEVFFDTMVIQLSSAVIYEKIVFDYNRYAIQPSLQNYLPLPIGNTPSNAILTNYFSTAIGTVSPSAVTFYGGNWYDAGNKTITICTLLSSTVTGNSTSTIGVSALSSIIVPVLYRLDLNNPGIQLQIYPTNNTPQTSFIEYIYPLNAVSYMEAPVFSYNRDSNLYLTAFISFSGTNQQCNLINYKITTLT